jgi:hypothetical protein
LLLARTSFLRSEILAVVRDCGPLLAVLATEIGVTLLVGRVDEVRLLFPLAFPIAVVGIQLWSAVVRSIERAGTPVA